MKKIRLGLNSKKDLTVLIQWIRMVNMNPDDLKKWRQRNEYSQPQLAKVLGVIPLTVSRWERGVREIPSFLHLALECLELKGGKMKEKGTQKRKEVKKNGHDL